MAAEAVYVDLDDEYPLGETEIWRPEPDLVEDPIVLQRKLQELKKVPKVKPSEFTKIAFYMPTPEGDGDEKRIEMRPFSFDGRRHMVRCYDTPARRVLLMCARQTEKSTLLGNLSLCYSAIVPGYRTLYVSPSGRQTETFSKDRIAEAIETSPVLKKFTTQMLSKNILEKQFVNRSKITLRYAFLNADRCLSGNSRVQLFDGSLLTLRELASLSNTVVVAADTVGRPSLALGKNARSTGVKEVVSVNTDFPIPLICTPDHRIFTGRGWVEAQDLRKGDYIASPHSGRLLGHQSIGEDSAWLLGALISEGSCRVDKHNGRVIKFFNTDKKFVIEFEKRARRFGLCVGKRVVDARCERRNKPLYTINVYSKRQGKKFNSKKQELWELGEFGSKSTSKHLPQSIFKATLTEKLVFLRALFQGDGWCVPEGGYGRSGYSTSSSRLAEDLVYLIWQLGIRCSLRTRPPSTENAERSFCIDFCTGETTRLVALMGEYRPDLIYRSEPDRNYQDRIPISYRWLRSYLHETYGLSTHTAWTRYRIQLRPDSRKDSVGRRVLKDIANKLQDQYLLTFIDPDTSWVEVHSVKPAGSEEVFDLTVDHFECFQANGLIVHNCRGIAAWRLHIDELQDVLVDNIPVIEQCLSHAPEDWRRQVYSGTPKSFDNTIEEYWSKNSTQCEWVVPCDACNNWNILGEENIGKKGIICSRCGKRIYANHPRAQWAAMVNMDPPKVTFEGYRIHQLMVPWRPWDDILVDYERYSRAKFHNEVLGRSFDSGQRPLTQHDIRKCCLDNLSMFDIEPYRQLGFGQSIYAGLDWGSAENSYTVITLATYIDGRFRVFYQHRFTGREAEPDIQIDLIIQLLDYFNVKLIGADYGGGYYPNDRLTRRYGRARVWRYQYVGMQQVKVAWNNNLGRFTVRRNEVMADIFNAIKKGTRCQFPKWLEFEEPYAQDFLNIYSEWNDSKKFVQYKHSPGKPDDSFHSFLYAWLVSMLEFPRPDIISSDQEDKSGNVISQYEIPNLT